MLSFWITDGVPNLTKPLRADNYLRGSLLPMPWQRFLNILLSNYAEIIIVWLIVIKCPLVVKGTWRLLFKNGAISSRASTRSEKIAGWGNCNSIMNHETAVFLIRVENFADSGKYSGKFFNLMSQENGHFLIQDTTITSTHNIFSRHVLLYKT